MDENLWRGHAGREREGEDFRDALDREGRLRIAPERKLAVRINHRLPERGGVHARQSGDIGGDFAPIEPAARFCGDLFNDGLVEGRGSSALRKVRGDVYSIAMISISSSPNWTTSPRVFLMKRRANGET